MMTLQVMGCFESRTSAPEEGCEAKWGNGFRKMGNHGTGCRQGA